MSKVKLVSILLLLFIFLAAIFSFGIAYGKHFGDITIVSNVFTGREFSNGTKSLEFFPKNLTVNVRGEPVRWINELKEPHTVTFLPESLITKISKFNDSSNAIDIILNSLQKNNTNLKTKLTPETQFLITNNSNEILTSLENNNITLNKSVAIFNSGILSSNNNNNNQNNSLSDITFKFPEVGVYRYLCLIHPWTTGTINIVKSETSIYDKLFSGITNMDVK
jgi:plastocyanin